MLARQVAAGEHYVGMRMADAPVWIGILGPARIQQESSDRAGLGCGESCSCIWLHILYPVYLLVSFAWVPVHTVIVFFIRDTSSIRKIGYSQVSALCIVAAHSYMPGRCNLLIVTRIASCNATMCFIWAVHFYYINYLSLSIQLVLIMFVSVLLLFHWYTVSWLNSGDCHLKISTS
jgi:hypothetical protein